MNKLLVDKEHWHIWASKVANPADPEEYSPAAVERLMKQIAPYVVQIKNVQSQFRPHNSTTLIDFATQEEADYYNKAWERYEEKKLKIEGSCDISNSRFLILVEFNIFRAAAEFARKYHIARGMYEAVQNGKAACCAVNYQATIAGVVNILYSDFNVSRDNISLIWGGNQAFTLTDEDEVPQEQIQDVMRKALLGEMPDLKLLTKIKKFLQAKADGMLNLPSELKLGPQSYKQRQEEIDRFQKGKSKYCLFTFKAGGIGLSLHHTDEFTKEKVRRRKSGWAEVEDIIKIPTRPRETILAPTYSAIELVQGLGRAPRITSLSDTLQTILFYRGTIEERVSLIVAAKLKCLSKVVRQRESWEDAIYDPVKYKSIDEALPNGNDDDDDLTTLGSEIGED